VPRLGVPAYLPPGPPCHSGRARRAAFRAILVPPRLRPAARRPGVADPPAAWACGRAQRDHGGAAFGSGSGRPVRGGPVGRTVGGGGAGGGLGASGGDHLRSWRTAAGRGFPSRAAAHLPLVVGCEAGPPLSRMPPLWRLLVGKR